MTKEQQSGYSPSPALAQPSPDAPAQSVFTPAPSPDASAQSAPSPDAPAQPSPNTSAQPTPMRPDHPTQTQPAQPSVARSTALMAVATLGSRVTGLVRTFVMAAVLGSTFVASAYQIANNLPNLIFDLVAGGILSAAFVPLYLLQTERFGKQGGDRYASNLLNIIVIAMGVIVVVATIFAEQFIETQSFTADADNNVKNYAILLFRIFAIQIVFYGLGGVFTCVLNANRVFFLPSIAPLFNNIVVIASFVAFGIISATDFELALIVLAVGTTLGVVAQFAVQIPALVKIGFKYIPRIDFRDPGLIETLKTGLPMLIYLIGPAVTVSLRNAFSLQTGDNGPAALVYAWTWFQLPHGIMAVSLARALFTEMSQAVTREDMADYKKFLHQGISGTLLFMIPMAGLMCVLSKPLMQIFYVGAFGADDVTYIASILGLWVLCLPFYSLQLYLFYAFASIRRFGLFAVISTALSVLQWGLYALLCVNPRVALAGIPIADSVCYLTMTVVLLIVLRRLIGKYRMRASALTGIKALVATLVGVSVVALLNHLLPLGASIFAGVGAIVLYGGLGLAIVIGLCRLMHVPELALAGNAVRGFMGRLGRKKYQGKHFR